MDLGQFVHERHLTNIRAEALQELCVQMAAGLNHFHSLELLHRDLKPANILIFLDADLKLFCKISDLGMAKEIKSGIVDMTPGVVADLHLLFFYKKLFVKNNIVYYKTPSFFQYNTPGAQTHKKFITTGTVFVCTCLVASMVREGLFEKCIYF